MKNISIRSTLVLSILGIISAALLVVVEQSKDNHTQPYFEEKLAASRLMATCLEHLKATHFPNEVALDNINDPNDTRIIGPRYSPITSGRGSLPVKLSTTNPDFAALMVHYFKASALEKGDHVAVCGTGSFPSLNIATLAAAEVLGLEVSFIASVTSSSWGANDPDYTFLDMSRSLIDGGLLSPRIISASIGANQDLGGTLSPEGRSLAEQAIARYDAPIIKGNSLAENIRTRMTLFDQREQQLKKPIKMFINIGGGIASLGSDLNSSNLPSGLLEDVKLNLFPDKKGVMFEMASRGIILINLRHVQRLIDRFELPNPPPSSPPGLSSSRPGSGSPRCSLCASNCGMPRTTIDTGASDSSTTVPSTRPTRRRRPSAVCWNTVSRRR
ncbi:MAG: poly-gamma-glutamate system protein [Bacteroidota bacterium]